MKYIIILLLAFAACNDAGQTKQQGTEPLILGEDPATGQSGYLTSTGEVAIPFDKYEMCLTDTFRTHAIVLTKNDFKWVVIDRQEKVLYEVFPFDNGPDFPSEGLFRMVKNGKIGYADAATFDIVIQPQFDCAFPFENGKARVSNDCQTTTDGEHATWTSDKWQFVDEKGNKL